MVFQVRGRGAAAGGADNRGFYCDSLIQDGARGLSAAPQGRLLRPEGEVESDKGHSSRHAKSRRRPMTSRRLAVAARSSAAPRDASRSAARGSTSRRMAPSPSRLCAESVPPWAWAILRQIDRPRPRPFALVVIEGLEDALEQSGRDARPGIGHEELHRPVGAVEGVDARHARPRRPSCIASQAFEHQVEHELLQLHPVAVHLRQVGREAGLAASTSRMHELAVHEVEHLLHQLVDVERRERLVAVSSSAGAGGGSARRRACPPRRSRAGWRAPRSRWAGRCDSKRSAACALLRMAVSGWFSSCASVPEKSVSEATRVRCVSCRRCSLRLELGLPLRA